MGFKTTRILYTAKNFETGLTDISANIELNGVSVATGVALAEIDAINFPGRYELVLTPVQITTYGGAGTYSFAINSATKNAPATAKIEIKEYDTDDLHLENVAIEAKVDTAIADIGTLQTDVTSVKGTVEDTNTKVSDGTSGLAALKALIDSVQSGVTSIQNTTRTVVTLLPQMPKPATGISTFRVDVLIYNTSGGLEDPDADNITLTLQNAAGLDRGNLIKGNVSGAFVIPAGQKIGVGKYFFEIEIAATTTEESLNLFVDYLEAAVALQASRATVIVPDVQSSGFALETTAQDILTDTAAMQPQVADIQSQVNHASYGLSVLKSALDAIDTIVADNQLKLNDAGFGLSALAAAITSKSSQVSVDNIGTDIVNNVKGAGFSNTTDSLKAISDRMFTGGQAV